MRRLRGPTILYTLENNKAVKMRIQCKKHFIINNNNDTRTLSVTPTPHYRHTTTPKQTMILHTKKKV